MQSEKFPIGFWNYVSIDQMDASCVQDWADAGMTLAMSPSFGPKPEHVRTMREILDAAHERGIRVILCDQRSYWSALTANGEETYRRDFQQAVKELGDHPSVLGFHVGDEPDREAFGDACKALRFQKELAPHLTPFCNLLPWHGGSAPRVGYECWAAYLDAYVTSAHPEFLCYDCYAQMNPGTEGWDMYFRNLHAFQGAAERHGIPFWTTLLLVGHFRYRCPKEDDLRWQVNTAVAHGARGLLWYSFYIRRPHDNYRLAPIDEHWERTETFAWLSRVNRSFLKSTAAVVTDLMLQKVSHVGTAWGGVPLFDGGGLISRAQSSHDIPLIVSEFKHSNGSNYVMVVNNSQSGSTQAEIWVRGDHPKLHHVGWMAEERNPGGVGWQAAGGEDYVIARPWLAPGQMELYRLESE